MNLSIRRLPATAEALLAEPLVLLHGWGCDSRSWAPLLAELNRFCDLLVVDLPGFGGSAPGHRQPDTARQLEFWIDSLLLQLPSRAAYLGWSLGGMLATRIALLCPERVSCLITLATNPSFVQRSGRDDAYTTAMPLATFVDFREAFSTAPEATLKRFCGLMLQGDQQEKSLLRPLRQAALAAFTEAGSEVARHWLHGLDLLAELDNRAGLSVPGLHIFGAGDGLVPVAAAAAWQGQAQQQVVVLEGAGHALHWSQPEPVAGAIREFFSRARYALDKRRVAASFSRAATTYDSVAELQRRVGNRLFDRLPALQPPQVLLDLGSGTGYFSGPLSKTATVIGLDIAEGMLQFARQQHEGVQHWLCADAEALPLADASVDVVFSSLAIQWCSQPQQLFDELWRVLRPGAEFFIATLGPGTLSELRDAWQQVDHFAHVNRFTPVEQLAAALQSPTADPERWAALACDAERITLHYAELRQLTHELKALGAHNMNSGQSSGLTGRARVQAFRRAYEQFRTADGTLPATYEVLYLYGRKPSLTD
jgi:malonyl-CoA O-methyltransferase